MGWVESSKRTTKIIRHFYPIETSFLPDNWQQQADNHIFDLFWVPIDSLPTIISLQNEWMLYIQNKLKYSF